MSISTKALPKTKKRVQKSTKASATNQLIAFLNKDISFSKGALNDKQKERFYAEFQLLLSSGVDIKTILDIVCTEQTKQNETRLYTEIRDKVVAGSSLSEAMESSKKFSTYEYLSIRIGEETGRLTMVMKELTMYYNRKIQQKRQLVSAFSYPALVMSVAVTAVVFMLHYMVPMFVDIFHQFNAELPALTQFIVSISNAISDYFLVALLFIIASVVLIMSARKKAKFRYYSAKIVLRIPIFGQLVKLMYLERFFATMSMLISSKIPMLRALQLVRGMIGFYLFEIALEKMEHDIMQGRQLHESMKELPLFDSRSVSLVKVAEQVNKLDEMFTRMRHQYSDDLEHKTKVVSSLLEPIMIIFVGVLVAVILVAMYLPMFQLSTTIN